MGVDRADVDALRAEIEALKRECGLLAARYDQVSGLSAEFESRARMLEERGAPIEAGTPPPKEQATAPMENNCKSELVFVAENVVSVLDCVQGPILVESEAKSTIISYNGQSCRVPACLVVRPPRSAEAPILAFNRGDTLLWAVYGAASRAITVPSPISDAISLDAAHVVVAAGDELLLLNRAFPRPLATFTVPEPSALALGPCQVIAVASLTSFRLLTFCPEAEVFRPLLTIEAPGDVPRAIHFASQQLLCVVECESSGYSVTVSQAAGGLKGTTAMINKQIQHASPSRTAIALVASGSVLLCEATGIRTLGTVGEAVGVSFGEDVTVHTHNGPEKITLS